MRLCRTCKQLKPLTEYYVKRRKTSPDGLNSICIPCAKKGASEWAKANREKHKAKCKIWANKNRSKVRASVRKWDSANRHVKQMHLVERRRATGKATPSWNNEFFMSEAYHLARLRTKVMGFKWHVDHIVPLQSKIVCGLHVHNNLQVVPAFANLSKGNRAWPDMP